MTTHTGVYTRRRPSQLWPTRESLPDEPVGCPLGVSPLSPKTDVDISALPVHKAYVTEVPRAVLARRNSAPADSRTASASTDMATPLKQQALCSPGRRLAAWLRQQVPLPP
eukprot:RCo023686